jgi:hypothetical protein
MRTGILVILLFSLAENILADDAYFPISIVLSTDKESYYEGEKITFFITLTNTDKENSFPVLLPHTQNVGNKLFCLNLYDRASNTLIQRGIEDPILHMMVHDTGHVKIQYLNPQEQVTIPIYWNDFENYYNYHTQNSSHHSFGVPLFAGHYKINISYNPFGTAVGDSLYGKYILEETETRNYKIIANTLGLSSAMIDLKIKRGIAKSISIERIKYVIDYRDERYLYYRDSTSTNSQITHITNLPPDSCELAKGEYFYSYFEDQYAEYVRRFDDGDIQEYRKFLNTCPDYLYTEEYNYFKQKTLHALQLPDKRFYRISYGQPGDQPYEESYCSADGTLCVVTHFVYDKQGKLKRKEVTQTQPCLEVELNGEKKSYKAGLQLESEK